MVSKPAMFDNEGPVDSKKDGETLSKDIFSVNIHPAILTRQIICVTFCLISSHHCLSVKKGVS